MKNELQYLSRKNIDTQKWDACITQSLQGRIYSYSWYLDAMADNWGALVMNDYEAVMPLPWRKKWGIKYLYQPYFTAQLGICARVSLTENIILSFFNSIPKEFLYWDFYLNQSVWLYEKNYSYKLLKRQNFILNLNLPFAELQNNYSTQARRNIAKAFKNNLVVNDQVQLDEILSMHKKQAKKLFPLPAKYYDQFKKVYNHAAKNHAAKMLAVYHPDGMLLSATAFLFSHQKAYYILPANTARGKTLGASSFLINAFIGHHASQQLILDFEGSSIPSVAYYYKSFGAALEYYSYVRYNRLPWPLRLLKK